MWNICVQIEYVGMDGENRESTIGVDSIAAAKDWANQFLDEIEKFGSPRSDARVSVAFIRK